MKKCERFIESILKNTKEIVLKAQQFQVLSQNELWNIRELALQTNCCIYLDCHFCDRLYVYSSNQESLQHLQTLLNTLCQFENIDPIIIG